MITYEDTIDIGKRIANLRKQKNWTQEQLSKELNYSAKTVSAWESERIKPTIECVSALAHVFNVTCDYIICGRQSVLLDDFTKAEKSNSICQQLHELLWQGKRFRYGTDLQNVPLNGVYVMFEKGETAFGGERIVRVDTNTGDNNLRSRIMEHLETANKDRSILRKNIGRAFLNQTNDAYWEIWEEKRSPRKDVQKENQIEKLVSQYLQEHFSFVVIEVPTKEERLALESKLIGTVAQCPDCRPSSNWFGLQSPIAAIRNSGMWQVQGLDAQPITKDDLVLIEKNLCKGEK